MIHYEMAHHANDYAPFYLKCMESILIECLVTAPEFSSLFTPEKVYYCSKFMRKRTV